MYGIKVLLALGLLLTTSYARPGSYGVKGGRNHKSTAIASASAQAAAQASGGCPGIAQSSASASATANAYASGSTSNAAATANAFVDGGNIGKAISCNDANKNANPVGDSDDLRSSNDHAGESDKQSEDPEDVSLPAWGHPNENHRTHGNTGSVGGIVPNQDHRPDCEVPAGVKGRHRTSGCTDKNTKENKPSVSNPLSKHHQESDGSAESPTGGEFEKNDAEPGSYATNKCSPRDATCVQSKPSSSSPAPYDESPDLSNGSSNRDAGYGYNDAGTRECVAGAPGCPKSKPSVSNSHPTYNGSPDSSVSSKHPTDTDGDHKSNPAHAGSEPCTSGASGCSSRKPSVPYPYPTNHGNPESAGSKHPLGVDGDYGANPTNSGSERCASGASGCSSNKPSVSNPYPSHHQNPDLSAGSKYPVPVDGGHGSNSANPGSGPCAFGSPGCSLNKPNIPNSHPTYNGNAESSSSNHPTGTDVDHEANPTHTGSEPCTAGSPGCSSNKPSVSNPYPSHHENPDLSTESQHPMHIDSVHADNPANSGSKPCAPGATGCSLNKPNIPDSHPTYNGNPEGGSKHPMNTDDGYGSNPTNSGSVSCTSGTPGCVPKNPTDSNAYPSYSENPDLSIGSKHPPSTNGNYGANFPNPESQPCTAGAFGCSENKPSILNSHEPYPGSSDLPLYSQHPVEIDESNDGSNSAKPGETPCYPGDPRCVGKKPKTTIPDRATTGIITAVPIECSSGSISCPNGKPGAPNAHPTFQGNPDLSVGSKHPIDFNGGHGDKYPTGAINPGADTPAQPESPRKPGTSNPFLNGEIDVSSIKHSGNPGKSPEFEVNPLNPFLHPHGQVRPPTGIKHPKNPNADSRDDSTMPQLKPNPSNPFLNPYGNIDSTGNRNNPKVTNGFPQNTNPVNGEEHSIMNGDCQGSSSCTGTKSTKNPGTTSQYPHETPDSSYNKPNPSNPFLPHNSEDDISTGIKHPHLKPPTLKNPGSFGESSYDRIDPHGNDKKDPDYPHETPDSSYNKPNPSNPFLPHNSEDKSTGIKHPDLKPPTLKNPGSFGESSYDRIDPHGKDKKGPNYQHEPNTWPEKGGSGSNPFLVDGPLINPKPGSYETSNPATSLSELPSTELNPTIDHGCQGGISSVNCNGKGANDNNVQNSYTGGYRGKYPSSTENYGVKTHQPGVKGGSRRRGPPARLQENPGFGQNDSGFGNKGSAYSSAHADASANAYGSAHASSSSSSGGGQSNAKSEAYSNFGGSGSSNAWASSSASSSASAFASSSSHQGSGHWEQPPIPEVPAE